MNSEKETLEKWMFEVFKKLEKENFIKDF